MTAFHEANRLSDVLKREYDPFYNRETISVTGGAKLALGTLVAIITAATGTATALAAEANVGDGVMGSVTVGEGAKDGVYTLSITKAVADAGDFSVTGPSGESVGTGKVGTAFDKGGISFTLADGATDFAKGDSVTITVTTDQPGQYVAYASGADVAGILLEPVNATSHDAEAVILARGPAVVARSTVIGLDDTAETQLADLGIIVRDDVNGGPVAIA